MDTQTTVDITRAYSDMTRLRDEADLARRGVTQAEHAYGKSVAHALGRPGLTLEQAWDIVTCVASHRESLDAFTTASREFGDLLRLDYPFIWKVSVAYGTCGVALIARNVDDLSVGDVARMLKRLDFPVVTLSVHDVPGHRFVISQRAGHLVLRHSTIDTATLPTGAQQIAAYIVAVCLKNRQHEGDNS